MIVADVIDTVPPEAIVELKVERPAADGGIEFDDDSRGGAVLGGLESGVAGRAAGQGRLARDGARTSSRRLTRRRAPGLEHGRLASLVPVSALNVPVVLPGGLPVKISR